MQPVRFGFKVIRFMTVIAIDSLVHIPYMHICPPITTDPVRLSVTLPRLLPIKVIPLAVPRF